MKHEIHLPPLTRLPGLVDPARRFPLGQRSQTHRRRRRLLFKRPAWLDTNVVLFATAATIGTGLTWGLLILFILAHATQ